MGLKTTGLRRPCVVMRLLAIAGLSHVSVASGTFNEATAQAMPDANLSGYAHNLGEYVVSTHHRSAGNGSSEVLSLPQRQLTPGMLVSFLFSMTVVYPHKPTNQQTR
jgi:hypothetical protein